MVVVRPHEAEGHQSYDPKYDPKTAGRGENREQFSESNNHRFEKEAFLGKHSVLKDKDCDKPPGHVPTSLHLPCLVGTHGTLDTIRRG